jgi:D-alanyl-lipoteichoic acid acyltransferase DltB (MBOAT superfamily)
LEIVSPEFLIFLFAVLILYYVVPRQGQNLLLLIASLAFYALWSWQLLVVLLILIAFNFNLAKLLEDRPGSKRTLIRVGVLGNLLALVGLKYAGFLVPEALEFLARVGFRIESVASPFLISIGLSYYSLQGISYLIDVSKGSVEATRSVTQFATYLAYFPKLLSGPIERAGSFIPQLNKRRVVDNKALANAGALITVGLIRKLLIANPLLQIVPSEAFHALNDVSAMELVVLALGRVVAIYNDFAGYTSIVRGISQLFGIELSRNFAQPFLSRSFTEFWNSWHITLSQWLRDYIYLPTTRSFLRRSANRFNWQAIVIPPLITMVASGLWHAAAWGTVLWGVINGIYLIVERLLSVRRSRVVHAREGALSWQTIPVIGLALWAGIPFLVGAPATFSAWQRLADWSVVGNLEGRVLLFVGASTVVDWFQSNSGDELIFLRWPKLAQAVLLAISVVAALITMQIKTEAGFIYQGF